jgi:hypothetical protein
VKLDGSTAMTGMLNFSGATNAGIQLSNLTDTQRAALTALDGMLIYNTTLSCLQYFNGGWNTLAAGAASTWYNGSGVPASTLGNNGDYYLNTSTGSIYQKSSGAWAVIFSYLSGSGGTMTGPLIVKGNGSAVGFEVTATNTLLMGPNYCGSATLNGTTAVAVSAGGVSGTSQIFLTPSQNTGSIGVPYVVSQTAGVGFTMKSTVAGDTNNVSFLIIN